MTERKGGEERKGGTELRGAGDARASPAVLSALPPFRLLRLPPSRSPAASTAVSTRRRSTAQLWGVALVDEKGTLLYGRNARPLFIPASNTKIVVTAVASAMLAARLDGEDERSTPRGR